MNAYLLKSGAILYPRRAEGKDDTSGDGFDVALPGTEAHGDWQPFTEPATPAIEERARKILDARLVRVTTDSARADRDTFIRRLIEDPERFRLEWDAKARAENPALTDEQLQASWDQLADQFGL
jgi:hypothetical protein